MGVSDEVRELLTLEGGREDVHVVMMGATDSSTLTHRLKTSCISSSAYWALCSNVFTMDSSNSGRKSCAYASTAFLAQIVSLSVDYRWRHQCFGGICLRVGPEEWATIHPTQSDLELKPALCGEKLASVRSSKRTNARPHMPQEHGVKACSQKN
jgi:hypothetical protein